MLAVGYSHIRPFDDTHNDSGAEGRAVVTALPRLSCFLTWIGVRKSQRWALASNGVRRVRQGGAWRREWKRDAKNTGRAAAFTIDEIERKVPAGPVYIACVVVNTVGPGH